MKKNQIVAQLYTVREFCKTPADIAVTLKKVREIGFDTVQVSGMGPIPEADLLKLCSDNQLTICATHENGKLICENPEAVIERLTKLNCKYTAYPFPHAIPANLAEALGLAKALNAAADKMALAGITLCYHNHDIEFTRLENGQLMLDVIYDNAPSVKGEIDTFWVQAGGCDPVAWVKKLSGRMPLLHLKDFGIINRQRVMRPIGYGNLDWKGILAAGEEAGVEYFIIEQDTCQKDPFESLADSFHYLVDNFVS